MSEHLPHQRGGHDLQAGRSASPRWSPSQSAACTSAQKSAGVRRALAMESSFARDTCARLAVRQGDLVSAATAQETCQPPVRSGSRLNRTTCSLWPMPRPCHEPSAHAAECAVVPMTARPSDVHLSVSRASLAHSGPSCTSCGRHRSALICRCPRATADERSRNGLLLSGLPRRMARHRGAGPCGPPIGSRGTLLRAAHWVG